MPIGKKAYAASSIKSIEVAQWLGQRPDGACFVGVDVGKTKLHLVLQFADGSATRPLVARNPGQIGAVIKLLQRVRRKHALTVAMEPTGTYGQALRVALAAAGIRLLRVEGRAVHDFAGVHDGVRSQHDGKDAALIAALASLGKACPWDYVVPTDAEAELRSRVRLLGAYDGQMTRWSNRIEGWLGQYWPELGRRLPLRSPTLLKLLRRYGSPQALVADRSAARRLRRWGGARLADKKIAGILRRAGQTRGAPVSPAARAEVRVYAQEALRMRKALRQQRLALTKLAKADEQLQRVGAAVGKVTACVLRARVGDPGQYPAAGAYLKALGLNLREFSSGQQQSQLHISKRGPGQARRWLFLAALRATQWPTVKGWYLRKVQRSGGKKVPALIAIARKLAMGIWRTARDRGQFQASRLFQAPGVRTGPTTQEARM